MNNEELIEQKAKEKVDSLFNEMCLWLNKADKEYKTEMWGDGEGRVIITGGVEISFSDMGHVEFIGRVE